MGKFSKIKKTAILIFAIIFSLPSITFTATAATADEIYQNNLKIHNNQATDQSVLEFYKLPSKNDYSKSDNKEIIDLAESITKNITKGYDKVKAIHDWVANNIWYDLDASEVTGLQDIDIFHNARFGLSVLKNKRGVCGGYTNLTVALLRAVGIPAKRIEGYAYMPNSAQFNPEIFYDLQNIKANHAWCEAFIDGRWIIIDITWDSKNRYKDGKYSEATSSTDKYFDISVEDISVSHKYINYEFKLKDFDLSGVKKITIPKSVKNIDNWAFNEHTNLTAVTMHDNITSIGTSAFRGCGNLKDITIPNSVTSIGIAAFAYCESITEMNIPESVISIGEKAFWGCTGMTAIMIPESVKIIGENTFKYCEKLTIHGKKGSYAETYAKNNNIYFLSVTANNY